MRFASGAVSFVAVCAVWLPYAAPAVCSALRSDPGHAHETCDAPGTGSSRVTAPSGPVCDLGTCATVATAPPEGTAPSVAILPLDDCQKPEVVATPHGESSAPPTPPPQL